MARSNVSTSLEGLQNWNLVRSTQVLGDRRDYFETSVDVWELFRTVVRERKRREFDPTIRALGEMMANLASSKSRRCARPCARGAALHEHAGHLVGRDAEAVAPHP